MHVTVSVQELACMRVWINMHAWVSATEAWSSATHSAQWQDLELIIGWLLNMETFAREGKDVVCASQRPAETFMRACRRPTEAACLRVRKCANNRQLIVAGAQRFLRHACAAHFRVIHTRKTPCALRIYTQTLIGVFFVHGNAHTHACLTGGWNLFYFDGRHL